MRVNTGKNTDWQLLRKTEALGPAGYALGQRIAPNMQTRSAITAEQQRVVCVVSPNQNAYSQTFIRAHIDHLPAAVKVLYGADYHAFCDQAGPLLRPALLPRMARAALRRSFKLGPHYFAEKALKRFFLDNRVDAVLAEFGPTATAVMRVCSQLNLPLIAHFHGFDAYRRTTLENFGELYKELFRSAAAVIAVSQDMRGQLVRLGAPDDRLHYNSCGVDVSVFQGADPSQNPPTFVAVGRFVSKKAPHITLLAFKTVVEQFPDARLVMIGDGPLWEACFQLRRALGLTASVDMPGPLPHSDIVRVMRGSRAFLQHSVRTQDGDSEGTPVAVLEAGATGLPVIATRHAGIKDAVMDEHTGLLVDEGDLKAMSERMLRLAADASLAACLGRAARERICSEYSMEKSIGNLWRIIERAIEERQKGGLAATRPNKD